MCVHTAVYVAVSATQHVHLGRYGQNVSPSEAMLAGTEYVGRAGTPKWCPRAARPPVGGSTACLFFSGRTRFFAW